MTKGKIKITMLSFLGGINYILTVNQLSDPPVHIELLPVHVKST